MNGTKPQWNIGDVCEYKSKLKSSDNVEITMTRKAEIIGVWYDPKASSSGVNHFAYSLFDDGCSFTRNEYELQIPASTKKGR